VQKLDSFDLAFLVMTGYATLEPVLKQQKASVSWGPEAALLTASLTKAWKAEAKEFLAKIRAAFDLSGDVSVDRKEINRLFKEEKDVGKRAWKRVEKKAATILEATLEQAARHFEQQKAEKAFEAKQISAEDWERFLLEANLDHVAAFVAEYPGRILHPEIRRLVEIVEQNPEMRLVDKAVLTDRIRAISEKGAAYFENMVDVQVGRLWTQTGLQLGANRGATTYMSVAVGDVRTCPVCQRLDGKTFNVGRAMDRIERALSLTGAAEIAAATPFPTEEELDNKSPEQVRNAGFFPPYHGSCRCDVVMIS